VSQLHWEKAKRRHRQRLERLRASSKKAGAKRRQADDERQEQLRDFADRHGLDCFACHEREWKRWAKSGWNKRGAWIVGVPCVARNRREKGLPAEPAR
jgi:hypothetical protein